MVNKNKVNRKSIMEVIIAGKLLALVNPWCSLAYDLFGKKGLFSLMHQKVILDISVILNG